jgi:hypothetical protein
MATSTIPQLLPQNTKENNILRVIAVNRHTLNQNACTAERIILQTIAVATLTKIS